MPEAGVPGLIGAGLIGVAIGLVLGALMVVLTHRRTGASQKELERLKEEHERYRAEVNQHFARTSALFRDVTERYRDLYEHMASGAQQLCRDQPQAPALDIPDQGLLGESSSEQENATGTEAPRSAGEESGSRTGPQPPTGSAKEKT